MEAWGILSNLMRMALSRDLRSRSLCALCLLLELAGIALATPAPITLKWLIDLLSQDTVPTQRWMAALGFFTVCWTAPTLLTAVRNVYSSRLMAKLSGRITTGLVEGYLSSDAWRKKDSAGVRGHVERLPYALAVVLDGIIFRTAPLILQLIASLAVMATIVPASYLVVLSLTAILYIGVTWAGLVRHAALAQIYYEAVSETGTLIGDVLRNARRVVSNGTIDFELEGIAASVQRRAARETRANWSHVAGMAAQSAVMGFGLLALLALAGQDVIHNQQTLSDFVLVQAYALRVILPLAGVGFILSQSATAFATLKEIFALQVSRPQARPMPKPTRPQRIEVKNLYFRYVDDKAIIANVSAVFPAQSISAIVGRNGSGKSTFAQLIAGVLEPDQGDVTFNGQLLRTIASRSRHDYVLYVPQRASLLNRSVNANLTYPPSTESAEVTAHRLAKLRFQDDGQTPDLEMLVGENGDQLSGGQVQKLELARVIGLPVPCLVLDESTSALDPVSEMMIIEALFQKAADGATIVYVTHHVAMAALADQVLWMEAGKIRAVGSHEELLSTFRDYAELWGDPIRTCV